MLVMKKAFLVIPNGHDNTYENNLIKLGEKCKLLTKHQGNHQSG